ncbi:putative zinc-binding metallopeptidase (plasmid) [Novosphingobium sp. BL-8A]|uniref:zinc-binding metallopeptidase family protein n=1 Tax=Novosphingobium sp. BL-8A TaxID=3127639 RepID=UPI00375691FD
MRAFSCPNCRRLLHFEARLCPDCSATLGYDPEIDGFRFLADQATVWRDGSGDIADVVVCRNNNDFLICNWLVASGEPEGLCRACRHNRTIPDLSEPCVPVRWAKIEAAKRRLFHTLLKLRLPLESMSGATPGPPGLAFDFLYDRAGEETGQPEIFTGHNGGVITLNLVEADDVERERMRRAMGEPYRTLLGHFRHEVGHYYWFRLVANDASELSAFRTVFGDETVDYEGSLRAHYADSGTKIWTEHFVTFYATSHPWEDFAETFAHFLHIVDVLATAHGFGLSLASFAEWDRIAHSDPFDPYIADAAQLADRMGPLAFSTNAMNRAMGQPDLYPFRLSEPIVAKLDYISRLVKKSLMPR